MWLKGGVCEDGCVLGNLNPGVLVCTLERIKQAFCVHPDEPQTSKYRLQKSPQVSQVGK